MSDSQHCPDRAVLEKALRGELPADHVELIAAHVETCTQCTETLAHSSIRDTLFECLSSVGRSSELEDESLPEELAQQLKQVVHSSTSITNPPSAPACEESFDFLSPAESSDELGRLGNYRILRLLGSGGMGLVFEAEDMRLNRRVALKVVRPRIAMQPGATQRLLREARAVAALENDHIVPLFEVGEVGGISFFAMPLLRGQALDQLLVERGRLSIEEVLNIAQQLAAALACAHRSGVIHRDLKPGNVWLESRDQRQAQPRVKVLDFGLARFTDITDAAATEPGILVGTPAYMAPEQVRGAAIDQRTDLFSLGAVLYEISTGSRPFKGNDPLTIMASLATEQPAPPNVLEPSIPKSLSTLILDLLAKDPQRRPASAEVVLNALERIEPIDARSLPNKTRPRTKQRWLIAACLLTLIGATGWFAGGPIIRYATNRGQLVIEVKDPKVSVRVTQHGVVVHDWTTEREFTLDVGDGVVEVGTTDGVFTSKEFSLKRGRTETLVVNYEPLEGNKSKSSSSITSNESARRVAELVLAQNGRFAMYGSEMTVHVAGEPVPDSIPGLYAIWLEAPNHEVVTQLLERSRDLGRSPQILSIGGNGLSDQDVTSITECAGLKHVGDLTLTGMNLTKECLNDLPRLPSLKYLAIVGPVVNDDWMTGIGKLQKLVGLGIPYAEITNDSLVALRGIPLEVLNLYECKQITSRGLNNVGEVPNLRDLNLRGTAMTNEDLDLVAQFSGLEVLWLGMTKVDDDGLQKLVGLQSLRVLDLRETAVTGAGLEQVAQLPRLEALDLTGTRVPSERVDALQEKLPNCKIQREDLRP
jgi:serine/threonine protein kinase